MTFKIPLGKTFRDISAIGMKIEYKFLGSVTGIIAPL